MSEKHFTLKELAEKTGSTLIGNPNHQIFSVADIKSAGPHDVSFLSDCDYVQADYLHLLEQSQAGAIFVGPKTPLAEGRNFLIHENPSLAFQKSIESLKKPVISGFLGIHSTAVIHPSARLGQEVSIGPYAVIDQEADIGDRTVIGAHCYVGSAAILGKECKLHPHVTVREGCQIGNRTILQPGVVVGSCGFGYATDSKGCHEKLAHLGNVEIGEDVEIGANAVVARARFDKTAIGSGSKLDALVLIAHNVKMGRGNLIAGQTGIAGSAQLEDHVVLGGQVGVNGHIRLTNCVRVAGKSGVSKSLLKAGDYGGIPALPIATYNRMVCYFRMIERLVKRLKKIEERLQKLD